MCRLIMAAIAVLASSTAVAEEIPLKDIWAYGMPGTNALQDGLPRAVSPESPLVEGIRKSLGVLPPKDEAGKGFVVVGTGSTALEKAHRVLAKSEAKPRAVTAKDDVSVVFFAHQGGNYVHLNKVIRKGQKIVIHYAFVPHVTSEVSEHFAIIPIGKLNPGKATVEIIRDPDSKVLGNNVPDIPKAAEKSISKSFSFVVTDVVTNKD